MSHPFGLFRRDLLRELAGRAKDHGVIWDALAFTDKCFGADQAVAPDIGSVENDSPNTDKATFSDSAAVQHREMTDGDVFADRQWKAGIGV